MAIELTDGGTLRLAVPVGTARGTALSRILSLRGSPGWIEVEGSVREWHFEGVTERDGVTFLYGPRFGGTPLSEILLRETSAAVPGVSRIARALLRLSSSPAGWFPLQSDSILLADGGEVLVLPPGVDRELRDMRPFEENRQTFEALRHPDLDGEAATVFSLSAAFYRVLTGRFPFWGDEAEELHTRVRDLEIPPPAALVTGLDDEVSETIMAGLRRGRRGPITLAQMSEKASRWERRPLVRAASEEEKRATRETAGAQEASAARSFQRRQFWRKNWRSAAVITAAVIAVAFVAGSILRNALAPRPTRGFPPEKVVQTFYSSMNTLDHEMMQACVVSGAGKEEIGEVLTLFVTSKVTQGYEGRSSIVSAAEWDKAGRPALVRTTSLYGVTNLSVTPEPGASPPVFLVKYQKWNPAPRPDTAAPDAPPQSEGHAQSDRVWMKQDHGDWVIYRIDRLESVPLPGPSTASAP